MMQFWSIKLIISSNFKWISSLHNLLAGLFWKISAWRNWMWFKAWVLTLGTCSSSALALSTRQKIHKHKFKCMFVCWNTDDDFIIAQTQRYRDYWWWWALTDRLCSGKCSYSARESSPSETQTNSQCETLDRNIYKTDSDFPMPARRTEPADSHRWKSRVT